MDENCAGCKSCKTYVEKRKKEKEKEQAKRRKIHDRIDREREREAKERALAEHQADKESGAASESKSSLTLAQKFALYRDSRGKFGDHSSKTTRATGTEAGPLLRKNDEGEEGSFTSRPSREQESEVASVTGTDRAGTGV